MWPLALTHRLPLREAQQVSKTSGFPSRSIMPFGRSEKKTGSRNTHVDTHGIQRQGGCQARPPLTAYEDIMAARLRW
jgi:hypothetical protein